LSCIGLSGLRAAFELNQNKTKLLPLCIRGGQGGDRGDKEKAGEDTEEEPEEEAEGGGKETRRRPGGYAEQDTKEETKGKAKEMRRPTSAKDWWRCKARLLLALGWRSADEKAR
jgi:hypothetical protein